jgi:multidrug efflux pump subunit AcrB
MNISRSLIDIFVRHKVASNLAMIMMVLSGFWAVDRINTQLDPTVQYPRISIRVNWQGASAEDVEQLVVIPVEQQLRTLHRLDELNSVSYNGGANIRISFNHEADMTLALDSVKDRIGRIRNLPADMEPLVISRLVDIEDIAIVLIKGPGDISELIPIVQQMERDLISRGIDLIEFEGLPDEELAIQVSSARLHELNTTLDSIAAEVDRRSSNTPAGTVGRGQGSRLLRSLDQKRDTAGFEQLEISLRQNGRLTRLGEIATIAKRPRDGQVSLSRDGQVAIEMHLYRSTDSDAVLAAEILSDWFEEISPTLPPGVEVHVYAEVFRLLSDQLNLILENGTSGLILVILSLFLFLNGRTGFWVMVGIPVSFLFATLLYFWLFAGSINILALITFVMAVGIVVDDAIVVGEDAVTHFESGLTGTEAAIAGAKRMFVPVVTSSLTTLAAFVPLLLVGGEMGDIILTLPAVLLCVILASLIECFLVLPGHLKSSFQHLDRANPGTFRIWFDKHFSDFKQNHFRPLLERAIQYPGATVAAALGCVLLSFSLVISQRVGVDMVLGLSLEVLEANVEFSTGATEYDKKKYLAHLEETLNETNDYFDGRNINGFVTRFNRARLNEESKYGTQYGSLLVEYAFEEDRTVPPEKFVAHWREQVKQMPFVEQLQLRVGGGVNNGQPDISLAITGEDIPTLKQASEELQEALAGYPGVTNVSDDLPYGKDQIVFSLTSAGKAMGLSTESLGKQLRAAYNGRRVQIFNQNERELEVLVMLPDAERNDLASLKQFPVKTVTGELVALGAVANLYNRRGIDVINHKNNEQSVTVSAHVDTTINNTDQIVSHLKENALKDVLDQYGLKFGLTGSSKRSQQILETMARGAILTLIFIYLILAWSFSSYLWPLAVMTAIPLGFTGAITGHWIMGMDVGAMSFLAFFSLTGIVVNDSIVLISFFRRSLDAGATVIDAIREAALSRFRAVILTSLTTIAGLSPLIFETYSLAIYMVPVAVTICFGLAFSTLLVLLVVPALIVLIEDGREYIRSRFSTPPINNLNTGV